MPSAVAKKAAGTYVEDIQWTLPSSLKWLTAECRSGSLSRHVERFCEAQLEIMDRTLVVVESVTNECIHCRIPCRCYDHEAEGTFALDVRFALNPQSGACQRSS